MSSDEFKKREYVQKKGYVRHMIAVDFIFTLLYPFQCRVITF